MFIKNLVINIGHLQIDTSNSFNNIAMFSIQNHPLPHHFINVSKIHNTFCHCKKTLFFLNSQTILQGMKSVEGSMYFKP